MDAILVFLEIFLQANYTGPSVVGTLKPSEKADADRKELCRNVILKQVVQKDGVSVDVEQTSTDDDNALLKKREEYWENALLGHPDERVGEGRSKRLAARSLQRMAEEIAVDGEILEECTQAVGYLWAAIKLLTAVGACLKDDHVLRAPFVLLEGRVAFVWHQSLGGNAVLRTTSLARRFLGRPLAVLEKAGVVTKPVQLLPRADVNLESLDSDFPGLPVKPPSDPVAILNVVHDTPTLHDTPTSGCHKTTIAVSNPSGYSVLDLELRHGCPDGAACKRFVEGLGPQERLYLIVEVALRLANFGKESEALNLLDIAATAYGGFNVSFSSISGIRREHQTKPFSQLVVRVTDLSSTNTSKLLSPRTTLEYNDNEKNSGLSEKSCSTANQTETANRMNENTVERSSSVGFSADIAGGLRSVPLRDFDPLTDLLEQPILFPLGDNSDNKLSCSTEEQQRLSIGDASGTTKPASIGNEVFLDATRPLTTSQRLVLLAHAACISRHIGSECDITAEQLRAIVQRCLWSENTAEIPTEKRLSWSMLWCSLWFRSKAECHRPKTRDRALAELKLITDAYENRIPAAVARQELIFQLPVRSRSNTILELGYEMMSSGNFMAAHDLFLKAWKWEDAVECLVASGRRALASDLLMSRLAVLRTPRLLCCLGDIEGNPKYYTEAWQLSNERFSRAKRSLGNYWICKKDYKQAADAYLESLKINPLFSEIWFKLGCCQMRLDEALEAVKSFSRVVALETECHEAWANLAAVHAKLEAWEASFKCITEAVKHSRDDPRLWDSYTRLSIKSRRLLAILHGTEKLLALGQKNKVPDFFFEAIADLSIDSLQVEDVNGNLMVQNVLPWFELVTSKYISNRVAVYNSYAKIATAMCKTSLAYELRWKEFSVLLAQIPQSFDNEYDSESFGQTLRHCVSDLKLAHKCWSAERDDQTIVNRRTAELRETLENLVLSLDMSSFPSKEILTEISQVAELV